MRSTDYLPENQCWKKNIIIPKGILIHYISAKRDYPQDPYNYDAITDIFKSYGYSAHELIMRGGEIKELVPIQYQAWHAGVSEFKNMKNLNKYFIGIEVAGQYGEDFTDEQYASVAESVNYHMLRSGIKSNMVKGHEQVSGPKVRKDYKTDPGPSFDWIRLGRTIERMNIGMS